MKQKKITLIGILLICICSTHAQIPGYIQGDEDYTLTLAFHKADTVLVVVPHNYHITKQEKTDIENYVFWEQYQKKPIYLYKTEAEFKPDDAARNLQFYGPFFDFELAEIQNIPFKQIEDGFLFNNEIFNKPEDAFFYINDEATRLYTCRNSTQVWHQYTNYAAGYFQLYIFRGIEVYLSGFCSNNLGGPRVNYIYKMREPYFETISTRHFDFQLETSLYSDSLRQIILEQADSCLEILCEKLKTDTVNLEKMTTYVYRNMLDLQQFLSMSPKMTILGKSFGAVNHVCNFNMAVFKHELAHTIIGRKVGIQSNSFFCEGFAVYSEYLLDHSRYTSDLDSAKIHLDLLSEEIITGPDHRFYSFPPLYPVSGVFTQFIIDKIGLETFKTIYAQESIENAFFKEGFPLAELITEFKNKLIRTETALSNIF